jgi:hypothetical protein
MPRVRICPAQPDRKTIDIEIARLRDLDLGDLQARWHKVLGRRPSTSSAKAAWGHGRLAPGF